MAKTYTIDVPVTLSVIVSGLDRAAAKTLARRFADALAPTSAYVDGYNNGLGTLGESGTIVSADFESSREDVCMIVDEEDTDDES